MKDKNYEGLAKRPSRAGKVVPAATALIFSVLLSDISVAQSNGAVETLARPSVILENVAPQNIVLDSERLSVDALAPVQDAELSVVEEAETAAPVSTTLALAGQSVGVGSGMTEIVGEQSAIGTVSESVASESPQKQNYALMLALVALISLVPMSRRHQ